MYPQLDCPEITCWQALFDKDTPPEQRERYERHLETCAACQERLDRAEECGDEFRRLIRQATHTGAVCADPTLSLFMQHLHEAKPPVHTSATEPADLYFLQPSDRPDLLGTLGPYEVEEVIGQGGAGIVLKAFEPALHRLVAIKVMAAAVAGSAMARQRFMREAKAAAAVCHDHVVPVHGVGEIDGLPYLVMQYVAGESLQARLDRTGALDVLEIVRIGMQTASGLAAAHAQGLIHRDIKPANLLLENGIARVRITDFGLARTTDDVQLTQNGVVAGTPEYMAPEQARGEPVDHRADLFSLGSVLYALCTGVPPFRGSSTLAMLNQVSEQAPRPIRSLNPDIPVWLETFIARLMAKNPDDRFQSAAEVAELLEGYLAHLRQPATVATPILLAAALNHQEAGRDEWWNRLALWSPHRYWMSALALLLVLLAGLGIALRLGVLGGGSLLGQVQQSEPAKPRRERMAFDFRKGIENFPALSLSGPNVDAVAKTDSEGLRITIPGGQQDTHPVLVEMAHRLRGGFDIAVGYELIAVGNPLPRYGAGVALRVRLDSPSFPTANLSRRRKPFGERFEAHTTLAGPDGKDQSLNSMDVKATRSKGKLRFIRNGSQLQYLVAEERDDFKTLQTVEIGTDDVQAVYLECFTMSAPIALEVRLTELVIEADQFPNGTPSVQVPTNPVEGLSKSIGWLLVAELFGASLAVLLLIGLGAWLYVRSNGTKVRQAPAEAVAPPISFTCSTCGKVLKAKEILAGKKVKCSQCGRPVLVPQTGPTR